MQSAQAHPRASGCGQVGSPRAVVLRRPRGLKVMERQGRWGVAPQEPPVLHNPQAPRLCHSGPTKWGSTSQSCARGCGVPGKLDPCRRPGRACRSKEALKQGRVSRGTDPARWQPPPWRTKATCSPRGGRGAPAAPEGPCPRRPPDFGLPASGRRRSAPLVPGPTRLWRPPQQPRGTAAPGDSPKCGQQGPSTAVMPPPRRSGLACPALHTGAT